MEVKGVSIYQCNPSFRADVNPSDKDKKEKKSETLAEKFNQVPEKYKIGGMVLATALAAATISGVIVHGKANRQMQRMTEHFRNELDHVLEPSRTRIAQLEETLNARTSQITELTDKNSRLVARNRYLDTESEKMRERLDEILDEELPAEEIRSRMYAQLKENVETGSLNYNPNEPPVTGMGQAKVYTDAVDLPQRVPTTNRSHIKELNIPEIAEDGSFEYTIPMSSEVKTTKMATKDFKPRKDFQTNVGEGYADSVEWNNDKIARDVLQNFFDGHGQTLDGVRIKFTPVGNGRYKVRLEGDSTYTADKAVIIGESTKREDFKAAGNYGEGLKMASLKLLKDKGASEVKIGSDNWDLRFKLMDDDLSGKKVMAYDLDKTAPKNGNYLEFETNDRDLLDTMRKTINRFYHSGNTDFRCPDYENDLFGIKLLNGRTAKSYWDVNKGEKGGMYISGQMFEFDGEFGGLEGAIMFLKEKPPKDVLDTSRDRTSLNSSDLKKIISWAYSRMPKDERVKFITAMEPCWSLKSYNMKTPINEMFEAFMNHIKFDDDKKIPHINFPKDKYVAYSDASEEVIQDLKRKGYTVCLESMNKLGMQTIRDLMGDARAHTPLAPDTLETKKINIIKHALKKLSARLEGDKHFTPQELDTKIYIFDRNSDKERRMSGNTCAEAIKDFGVSKGFWIDRTYMQKSSFGEVLETALHELSHKAGGDESMEFSYKLTDVNSSVLQQLVADPETRAELKMLNRLWNECMQETLQV